VISSSPTELGPVLDAVAKNAASVCEAEDIGVFQLDVDVLRAGARSGAGPKQEIGSMARIRRDLSSVGRFWSAARFTCVTWPQSWTANIQECAARSSVLGCIRCCARRC